MSLERKVNEYLRDQFGIELDLRFEEMGKNRVYAYTCDAGFPSSKGIYFGTIEGDGFRLSIEGSFIVGRIAKKNVVEIDREHAERWMRGESLILKDVCPSFEIKGYIILRYKNYYLGCGKIKNGKIINFVPKNRRI